MLYAWNVRVFENFQKKFLNPKMFVEIFLKILNNQKCVVFISLKTALKLHRNTYYMLYAWYVRVLKIFRKKF